ncbi:MAG: methenyltetrahydromethanopterin cyclohydrolase [Pirellulaceae bacterium]|nr:methenyltetrahydromethanopterin cyclohydrolase [Pirellulaceae bacterium]
MASGEGLNQQALQVFLAAQANSEELSIAGHQLNCGAHLLDFGVHQRGGLAAGIRLASLCLGGLAEVAISSGDRSIWRGPWVRVSTDHPVRACLFGQYAGWPVQGQNFFAMGSGPMRLRRGKEPLLKELAAQDNSPVAVGVLECDQLPDDQIAVQMAAQCQVTPDNLWLAVAPTRSLAGCVQVVARSVETSLHKLYELGFPLISIKQAFGIAPLPPPTPDAALGIGRTNDAILYGGHVTLWVDADDEQIRSIGAKVPSSHSRDFGEPFADIFKRCQFDFYRVDPALFSPAEVAIHNLRTGRAWSFGELREDLVAKSFAIELMG